MVFRPLSDTLVKERTDNILLINKQRLKEFKINKFPLVSIIILNKNGKNHLDKLFNSIKRNTLYPNYEIIILDNCSNDNSIDIINNWSNTLPIRLICNHKNETFSHGNNIAVQNCNGEFLLFLNNDIEVTYGWLIELVRIFFEYDNIGCVGGKLLYPFLGNTGNEIRKNLRVQHSGVAIKKTSRIFNPYNTGNGLDAYDESVDRINTPVAVTGALLLMKREVFQAVGSFNESYVYGLEDVDICLKSIRHGYKVIYTPTSMAFHFESATIKKESFSLLHNRSLNNLRIFNELWSKWLIENSLYVT